MKHRMIKSVPALEYWSPPKYKCEAAEALIMGIWGETPVGSRGRVPGQGERGFPPWS